MKEYFPFSIAKAYVKDDVVDFFSPYNQISTCIKRPIADFIIKFQELCDGNHTLNDISRLLHVSDSDVNAVNHFLIEQELIFPADQVADVFNQLGNNPQVFPPDRQYEKPNPLISYSDSTQVLSDKKEANNQTFRHSTRIFSQTPIPSKSLINILQSAYCLRPHNHTVSSGGSLYPLDIYIIANRISNINPGIYLWDPISDCLRKSEQPDCLPVKYAFDTEYADNPACWFIIALASYSQIIKYGNRGIRYAYLEAGQLAHALETECAKHNLGYLWYGGFIEEGIQKCIQNAPHRVSTQDLTIPEPLICCAAGFASQKSTVHKTHSNTMPIQEILLNYAERQGWLSCRDTILDKKYQNVFLHRQSFKYFTADGTPKQSYGVGETVKETNVKALAEAVERYSSTQHIAEESLFFKCINDTNVVQYNEIYPLTKQQEKKLGLKTPSPTEKIACVEGRKAQDNSSVYIPTDLIVYWDHNHNAIRKTSSNGVAAFSDYHTACERALFELIERHAFLLHWYKQIPCSRIHPSGLLKTRFDILEKNGAEPFLLDISISGLPIALCVIYQNRPPYFTIGLGSAQSFAEASRKASFEAIDTLISWTYSWDQVDTDIKSRLGTNPTYPSWGIDHLWWYARSHDSAQQTRFLVKPYFTNPSCYELDSFNNLCRKYNAIFYEYKQVIPELHVVRALSKLCIPLLFGVEGEATAHPLLRDTTSLKPHPLS